MASAAQRRIKSISYAKYGYIFILPFFLVYFFFQLWPLINTFILSFQDNKDGAFIGLANYKTILFAAGNRTAKVVSKNFFMTFRNTIILWVGNFIPQLILSLSLAVWFTEANTKIPGQGLF